MNALRLAVVGDPVSHSRSPEIFGAFISASGRTGSYEAIRIESGEGSRGFERLRESGYTGLNVTTPLKEEAFARAETRDDIALAARSVNVLVLGSAIAGYNTDGAGALGALAAVGLGNLEERRILVLGAGPTARASLVAIAGRGARADIWNRTEKRALDISRAHAIGLFEPGVAYDAVLSALSPEVTPGDVGADVTEAIARAGHVIDANYGARSTLAKNFHRASVIDGFEMLHASARASFEIFANAVIE